MFTLDARRGVADIDGAHDSLRLMQYGSSLGRWEVTKIPITKSALAVVKKHMEEATPLGVRFKFRNRLHSGRAYVKTIQIGDELHCSVVGTGAPRKLSSK